MIKLLNIDTENQYYELEDRELCMRIHKQLIKKNPNFKFLDRIQKEIESEIEKQIGKKVSMTCWDGYDVVGEYDIK